MESSLGFPTWLPPNEEAKWEHRHRHRFSRIVRDGLLPSPLMHQETWAWAPRTATESTGALGLPLTHLIRALGGGRITPVAVTLQAEKERKARRSKWAPALGCLIYSGSGEIPVRDPNWPDLRSRKSRAL